MPRVITKMRLPEAYMTHDNIAGENHAELANQRGGETSSHMSQLSSPHFTPRAA